MNRQIKPLAATGLIGPMVLFAPVSAVDNVDLGGL